MIVYSIISKAAIVIWFISMFFALLNIVQEMKKCRRCGNKNCPGYTRPFSIYHPTTCFLTPDEKKKLIAKIDELE